MEEGRFWWEKEDTSELVHLKTTDADLMELVLPKHFFSSKIFEKKKLMNELALNICVQSICLNVNSEKKVSVWYDQWGRMTGLKQ